MATGRYLLAGPGSEWRTYLAHVNVAPDWNGHVINRVVVEFCKKFIQVSNTQVEYIIWDPIFVIV